MITTSRLYAAVPPRSHPGTADAVSETQDLLTRLWQQAADNRRRQAEAAEQAALAARRAEAKAAAEKARFAHD